ncbi:MAG: DUF4231 domain-containing protein [Alphaproteobacteria bacterium]|nr:DUF4231 domain-containing protein [Alphaproteobacteria bacterium]
MQIKNDDVEAFCRSKIGFYDRYAKRNMVLFGGYQVLAIVLTAATSVLVAAKTHLGDGGTSTILVASLPAIATVCASVSALFQFQAKWISARASCEAIRLELEAFQLHVGAYGTLADAEARGELARRVLDVVRGEAARWKAIVEPTPKAGAR